MISYLYLGSLCWKIESLSMRSHTPRLVKSVDEEFHNMDGHVADAHTNNYPHTCEKCDKKFYSEDGLQRHIADVYDQCEEVAEFDFDKEEEQAGLGVPHSRFKLGSISGQEKGLGSK